MVAMREAEKQQVFFKNGCNPPLLVVGESEDGSAVWVVNAGVPWACARLVRKDQLWEARRG